MKIEMGGIVMPNNNVAETEDTKKQSGVLSDVDIKQYINKNEIVIYPYNEENLTGLGYNLSFTKFIYSLNKKTLCEIECEGNELFCYAEPNDTLLIISHEAVWITKSLSGTFYSKVGIVSKGFGHISTTLDPEWEGPLLFSLNNPTNQRIKLSIGNKIENGIKYETFVTLIFHKMISKANKTHDNEPGRIYDILKHVKDDLKAKNNTGEIINVFDKIDLLQIKRLQIGNATTNEDKKMKISEFQIKYEKLDKVIDDCIIDINIIKKEEEEKARKNADEEIKRKKAKNNKEFNLALIKYIIINILLIGIFIVILKFILKVSGENLISITTTFSAIPISVSSVVLTLKYQKLKGE